MTKIADVEIVRLKALANLLDDVPEKDFDLSLWVEREPQEAKTHFFGLIVTQPACGFAGCAVGWAIHTKMIPGLKFGYLHGSLIPVFREPDGRLSGSGWDAVEIAFGISRGMAQYLFHEASYKLHPRTTDVATRIRRLVVKVEAIRARRVQPKPLPDSLKKLVETFNPVKV